MASGRKEQHKPLQIELLPNVGKDLLDRRNCVADSLLHHGVRDVRGRREVFHALGTVLLEFRVCWAWLRQRSLFDRGVYGSWRAVDVGFEPLVTRRRSTLAPTAAHKLAHPDGEIATAPWRLP